MKKLVIRVSLLVGLMFLFVGCKEAAPAAPTVNGMWSATDGTSMEFMEDGTISMMADGELVGTGTYVHADDKIDITLDTLNMGPGSEEFSMVMMMKVMELTATDLKTEISAQMMMEGMDPVMIDPEMLDFTRVEK